MDPRIGNFEVWTQRVGTTIAIGFDDFRSASLAFLLSPRLDHSLPMGFARPVSAPTNRTISWALGVALAWLTLPQCFAPPVSAPTNRTISWALGVALPWLTLPQCFENRLVIAVPVSPIRPDQPDQQQLITEAENE